MIDIASCESGTAQFDANGKVIRDRVYGTHLGIFQISESWISAAKIQGYDIYTPSGNIAFALYLYNKYGTSPWTASKKCWGSSSG